MQPDTRHHTDRPPAREPAREQAPDRAQQPAGPSAGQQPPAGQQQSAGQQEPRRHEAQRQEPRRQEPQRQEAQRQEAQRQEAQRQEAQQPAPAGQAPAGATPEDAAAAALAELEDRWRRAVADLDNLRKRYARELDRERTAERGRVAAAWLPVLDNLDRALDHAATDPEAIVEGVRAVRDHALSVLAALGYRRHDEAGVPFDPARHEVVAVVEESEDAPAGTVVRVLRPGYGDADRQLRPGAVTVARPRS